MIRKNSKISENKNKNRMLDKAAKNRVLKVSEKKKGGMHFLQKKLSLSVYSMIIVQSS